MDPFLTHALSAIANGGAGAVIALALVWYLKSRDTAEVATGRASSAEKETLSHTLARIASASERHAESAERSETLLQKCVDGHHENALALARVETKLDIRARAQRN